MNQVHKLLYIEGFMSFWENFILRGFNSMIIYFKLVMLGEKCILYSKVCYKAIMRKVIFSKGDLQIRRYFKEII